MVAVGAVVSATVFETGTETEVEVVWFPAASRARAVMVWDPLDALVVFQVTEYGEEVSSDPRLEPSSRNCTPETPTLSLAVADTVTEEPETVALALGAVIDTVGAVVSPLVPPPPVPPPE